jgi:hypothetical protein
LVLIIPTLQNHCTNWPCFIVSNGRSAGASPSQCPLSTFAMFCWWLDQGLVREVGGVLFRARNEMTGLPLTPVLPEATCVGALSALLRHSGSGTKC